MSGTSRCSSDRSSGPCCRSFGPARLARLVCALLAPAAAAALAACSAEEVFIGDAALDTCDGAWPICQTMAGCRLGEGEYIEGRFPGGRSFIVSTRGAARIRLSLLLGDQLSAGSDTEIRWYEPGCFERYTFASEGRDVFRDTDESGVFNVSQLVHEGGDHLVELYSDAYCSYLLKVKTVSEE